MIEIVIPMIFFGFLLWLIFWSFGAFDFMRKDYKYFKIWKDYCHSVFNFNNINVYEYINDEEIFSVAKKYYIEAEKKHIQITSKDPLGIGQEFHPFNLIKRLKEEYIPETEVFSSFK